MWGLTLNIAIDYYYGFEVRYLPVGVFISSRNDSRYGDNIQFNTAEEAFTWIRKTVELE